MKSSSKLMRNERPIWSLIVIISMFLLMLSGITGNAKADDQETKETIEKCGLPVLMKMVLIKGGLPPELVDKVAESWSSGDRDMIENLGDRDTIEIVAENNEKLKCLYRSIMPTCYEWGIQNFQLILSKHKRQSDIDNLIRLSFTVGLLNEIDVQYEYVQNGVASESIQFVVWTNRLSPEVDNEGVYSQLIHQNILTSMFCEISELSEVEIEAKVDEYAKVIGELVK